MEWQPIETAPTKGAFLVFGGEWEGEWSGTYPNNFIVLVEASGGSFSVAHTEYYGPCIVGPTHWYPLPEPPVSPQDAT